MTHRSRQGLAAWIGAVALFCQIILPFGHNPVAELLGFDCPGLVEAADHDHAGNLARSSGRELPQRQSDRQHERSCPVCLDLQFATPLTTIDPPLLLVVNSSWVAFTADWTAPVPPAAVGFSRPLPRAPPLPA